MWSPLVGLVSSAWVGGCCQHVGLRNDLPNTDICHYNANQFIMVWPSSWMDKTFTSRARTEQLLRPELDNSLLPSDFEKAVDFLPSSQRHWQVRVTFLYLYESSQCRTGSRRNSSGLCSVRLWHRLAQTSMVADTGINLEWISECWRFYGGTIHEITRTCGISSLAARSRWVHEITFKRPYKTRRCWVNEDGYC